ncbi:MAG TPA: citrate (Si)-synthase, partial [Cytophagales bacterium]|nr:citrate (Si)-synthase [Cytophagales bacterium]
MSNTAEIKVDGKSYELPLIEGTEQEKAIDISKLRGESGIITIDPGFKNTGSTKSAITFLDGEKGILRYRGYPIEQLAEKSTFLEVAYLLIYGELPDTKTFETFKSDITNHTLVHEDIKKLLDGFPSAAHPMGVLSSLVTSLTAFYPQSLDPNRPADDINLSIIRILAKMPTFAAWSYKNQMGHPVNYPDNSLDYCSNFLKMMFGLPTEKYEIDPVVAAALDKLLILHADHE